MARSVQAERWADELVTLSDSPPENATAEQVAVVKLQADTRKWIIGKRLPKKYGDAPVTSVNVSQTNNALVLTVERQRALQETWRKLKELEG